jgi:type II secretory pathway pseudopilin PulG
MAMAIVGIIIGSITTAISQVFNLNTRTSNHMIAIRQVQNAGYWVSHDALMAQSVSTNTTGNGFPLVLNWTEWNGTVHNTTYSIVSSQLKRSNGGNESIIANYIDQVQTSCNFTSNKLSFTVTATVGSGSKAESETRKYEVNPRPGS